ncbi:hypothetical protein MtrunA17_Chr8g0357011 [Medicago truncatula]|uniref:Transmembrane protein n=1 Tax=Medicago truncatula TaxID=3880 RepID=A0A396GM43_MEDTR|nr:hypothetical protein MtrunA17_Chr8g0357011 [Medicago truncatula]
MYVPSPKSVFMYSVVYSFLSVYWVRVHQSLYLYVILCIIWF